MGFNIGGNTIVKNAGGGVTLNTLVFNSAGQGTANPIPGYCGFQQGGGTYYSTTAGWPINGARWSSGINLSNGVFTCPVAGLYAIGYNGIHRGGQSVPAAGNNTYGYAGFAKNGTLSYYCHWNIGDNLYWEPNGTSAFFSCAAGDTLTLLVNCDGPLPVSPGARAYNYGLYPNEHHAIWCKLVG